MTQVLYILFAAGLTYAVSLLMGNALLRAVRVKLARSEALFLGFVLGAACLSAIVYGLAAAGLARKGVFLAASILLIAAAVLAGGHRFPTERLLPVPKPWLIAFCAIYGLFAAFYLSVALAPEVSVDGTTHYLATVARDAQAHGLAGGMARDGVSMLFLFAFAFQKHSAAAMVELLFLLVCPWGMLSFGQRIGNPAAGVTGALLFFASPIVGKTGSSASVDVAIACLLFAIFYLYELRLLAPMVVLLAFAGWAMVAHPWPGAPWSADGPFDLTIRGVRLHGLLGPVFLLSPLALLALRYPAGRRLVPAALVSALPFLVSHETRSLIPCLPFVALALALVLTAWRAMAPAVLLAHSILSWPAFIPLYCDEGAWRLTNMEWAAALRIEPEDHFLRRSLPGYDMARYIDMQVPQGEAIFSLGPFPRSYVKHEVVNGPDSIVLPRDLAQLRNSGNRWLLIPAADIFHVYLNRQEWGLTFVAAIGGYQLYRID